jgi:hypothetical protein
MGLETVNNYRLFSLNDSSIKSGFIMGGGGATTTGFLG